MSETITINGVKYDAHSGLSHGPAAQPSSKGSGSHATAIHGRMQRSTTLHRGFTKRPEVKKPSHATVHGVKKSATSHTRSPHITKFARDPQPMTKKPRMMSDIGPSVHPHVAKAHAKSAVKHQQPAAPAHVPARQIKEQAISQALANAAPAKPPKKSVKQRARSFNVAAASLAVMLLAGYLTYLNLPSLSVRVAAAQAGINASYPEYRPSGYSLSGPVAYSGGEVSMNFKSNSGPQQFALNQARSSWDSSALLTNYVQQKSGDNYATYSDAGLTIYTYGSNAAWVNGGILYTLEGDAPLSNEQIRHIATSM